MLGPGSELNNALTVHNSFRNVQRVMKSWVITPLETLTTAFAKPWLRLAKQPETFDVTGFYLDSPL